MPLCQDCGSSNFSCADGHFFCDECGTESRTQRETEEENMMAQLATPSVLTRVVIKTSKSEERVAGAEEMIATQTSEIDPDIEICERAMKQVNFPDHLRTVGYRLCTFVKVVANVSYSLSNTYGVPPSCSVQFSKYLLIHLLMTFPEDFSMASRKLLP